MVMNASSSLWQLSGSYQPDRAGISISEQTHRFDHKGKQMALPVPHLVTSLPGPKAKAFIARDDKVLSPSYTRCYPLVVGDAKGAVITDLDGNRFLDFTAGIAVCSTGHCHPEVVSAIKQQADTLLHMSGTDFYYPGQLELAETLARLAPGSEPKKVFFTNSGAESIEAAVKLARFHTRRPNVIAFSGSFHGRTMGALSLTASKAIQRQGFGSLLAGVWHTDYAHCYRCPINLEYPDCQVACVDNIEQRLFKRQVNANEVAAIVVESVQGEGGYVVPPKEFMPKLRAICDKHGIMLVVDEVQSGMGRTGKMFAVEHTGVVPDIIATAKGIASGLPLGAIIAKESVMDWKPGTHASTFGGNPVACAAALATIKLLERELMANATTVGNYLMEKLREMQASHACIGDIRGQGLMVGMELVKPNTKSPIVMLKNGPCLPDHALREKLVDECFLKGLLLLGCGESTIRFCPPLIVTKQDVDTALSIIDSVLKEIA